MVGQPLSVIASRRQAARRSPPSDQRAETSLIPRPLLSPQRGEKGRLVCSITPDGIESLSRWPVILALRLAVLAGPKDDLHDLIDVGLNRPIWKPDNFQPEAG